MAESSSTFKSAIPQLTDDNYPEWCIDIKAELRKKKLWEYTQSGPDPDKSGPLQAKWLHSSCDAADIMTPTISGPVKKKLTADAFDNGFVMWQQLVALYTPKGDAEFMRLTREYYTIRYDGFTSMTAYLTQIKTLEERIRNTGVTLDDDKRTLLCLGMSLPEKYQYLTKIWEMTPGITAEKARNMLLDEERRTTNGTLATASLDTGLYQFAALRVPEKRTPSRKARDELECPKCGKPHEKEDCWKLHPELAPEWLQEKWHIEKRSRKRKYVGEFEPEQW